MTSLDMRAFKERFANLTEQLSNGDEIDNYILIQLNKSVMAKPKKVGNGPEREYHCPDCDHDLLGYLNWKDDKFCEVCGKRIKKPKRVKSVDYNFCH